MEDIVAVRVELETGESRYFLTGVAYKIELIQEFSSHWCWNTAVGAAWEQRR
jgi:hypothetical protein